MLIANPIYDSVFKYLLEDLDIARELLSVILDEEIISIEVKPQETSAELRGESLTVFRLDFKAIIKTANGENKKILIELQKAKHFLDIMRFRRYLADNYQKEDYISAEQLNSPLPIVTIYFLGFKLNNGLPAIFNVKNQIRDVISGEVLVNYPKEPFVELLNHESYTIQIPLLTDSIQSRIEKVLVVFNQKYVDDDKHELNYQSISDDPLVNKMVNRLTRAIADDELRKIMNLEDEMDKTFNRVVREKDKVIEEKDKELEVQAKELEVQAKELEVQAKELEVQAKELEVQAKEIEVQAKEIEERDKKLEEKDSYIAELLKKLSQNQSN
jgi:hypothetical protein